MRATARALARPVLVLDGWHSPGVSAWGLARRLCSLTSGRWGDFAWATYPWAFSLESAVRVAERVIRRRGWARQEIDIVGISMGGIVARALGSGVSGSGGEPVVRAKRIFTIASPHRGARLAKYLPVDRAARDMGAGSEVLRRLDEALDLTCEEMVCHAMSGDWLVGEENTAPAGMEALCVKPSSVFARWFAHYAIVYDVRVQVDIARRLRGEVGAASR
jgi:pimeloyl-ACP methyl ester carboxylesterase